MTKPLPPTVGERLAKCGTRIFVWGIVPGADVTLEVGGVEQTIPVSGTSTTFTVDRLAPDVTVRAYQRTDSEPSGWSNIVTVEDILLPPMPPSTEREIPDCAECVRVWGASPGSKIEIRRGMFIVAEGEINRLGRACLKMNDRPTSSMRLSTITCGEPSPTFGSLEFYATPPRLPRPSIVEPVFECQNKVALAHLVPGATVEIYVTDRDGIMNSLGTLCACSDRVLANIHRRIQRGDKLKATQRMLTHQCNSRSLDSIEIDAVPPDSRIQPTILEPVYEGDRELLVNNQIDGGTLSILSRESMDDPEVDLGSRPSSEFPDVPVPNPPLRVSQVLRAKQELCGVTEFSKEVVVQRRPPSILTPVIRTPLYACGEVVAVDNVMPGAWVFVYQTPPGATAPEYLIGKAKASGSSVHVEVIPVFPHLLVDSLVTAYQEVGGVMSDGARMVLVESKTDISPPLIVPPAMVGHQQVWLTDVVPGAHLRILDRGIQIGSGTLADSYGSIRLWRPIPDQAILTARQSLCHLESVDSPPVQAISPMTAPDLDEWLNMNPSVANTIVWEDASGPHSWLAWSSVWKAELREAFRLAWNRSSIPVPEIPTNQEILADDEFPTTILHAADAWAFFKASVAQSLSAELSGYVDWSITGFTEDELAMLFDSREMFAWTLSGYRLEARERVLPAPPGYILEFLRAKDMIGSNQRDTIGLLLNWCREFLFHYDGKGVGFKTANVELQWQYRGFPPLVRVVTGTPDNEHHGSRIHGRTAGCWGTTAILRCMLRVVNIPVKLVVNGSHAQPWFMNIDQYLSHGDDPYSKLSKSTPRFDAKELLIDQATFDSWFGPGVSEENKRNNVSRRTHELALIHLPNILLSEHCRDMEAGNSHANSMVFESLSDHNNVAELEAINLWERLDTKIASFGGCANIPRDGV